MAFAIGISISEFKHLNPTKLGYCLKGQKIQRRMQDEISWYLGAYIKNAFDTVMSNFSAGLNGKRGKATYIERPVMSNIKDDEDIVTESNEECAVFEMKQRINLLKQQGLPESPM